MTRLSNAEKIRLIQQQRLSCRTLKQFCESAGVKPATFYLWRKKYEGKVGLASAPPAAAADSPRMPTKAQQLALPDELDLDFLQRLVAFVNAAERSGRGYRLVLDGSRRVLEVG